MLGVLLRLLMALFFWGVSFRFSTCWNLFTRITHLVEFLVIKLEIFRQQVFFIIF